ncbi:hypothetical protein G6O67_004926 [Ophiocordyceps sinensis]|uniref:Uncharacterized protein n=2 Tax=Ophiocordyceps sinensis TaxID=72228 RepID=A0A8H4V5K9_9HYPO|nr:hypothetical protein OCS_00667 [Ophiocordyceps sinensis CO18]KAF4508565.1 hypothetical protein G6O67_004926 [Ophiocordyceps sinensis]
MKFTMAVLSTLAASAAASPLQARDSRDPSCYAELEECDDDGNCKTVLYCDEAPFVRDYTPTAEERKIQECTSSCSERFTITPELSTCFKACFPQNNQSAKPNPTPTPTTA